MFFIYKISNSINNKVYIGQTCHPLKRRFNEHCFKNSRCTKIANAIKKYGKENFKIEPITIAHTQNISDYWEVYFIKSFQTLNRDKGYNLREGGSKGKFNNKGRKHTQEELKKMSESQRGRTISEEAKRKMSIAKQNYIPWNKGKHSIINQYVKYPKLTKTQIESIKLDKRPSKIVGKEYGVSKTTIQRIRKINERL